ncbi:cytochrome C oxidase subunit IV family protein [Mycobacterium sp. CVI_P3]|uniref:Cytochrome C oxidase subunit IV family protein n=1 Tax=Mycobacterium pinniadriaticum TaxID=2994102 RepID=A0ABT3SMY8_9MYCO|nr:cytochrome C oxidase subunit IV family protein [Mycobacterium pinniadriaticum]MCX2934255.1 cytochrome C oxidase subunit IV family protein [Mycobacterium pinniadriaticum]MCX2940707.1 cytochrome C oxidase subunit IV family protein [Mycobacterium pinniadriaticum]
MTAAARFVRGRSEVVWAILIGATVVSLLLGEHSYSSSSLAGSAILVIAFVKVYLVGANFMELKEAPTALRAVFSAYCILACAALVGIFTVM